MAAVLNGGKRPDRPKSRDVTRSAQVYWRSAGRCGRSRSALLVAFVATRPAVGEPGWSVAPRPGRQSAGPGRWRSDGPAKRARSAGPDATPARDQAPSWQFGARTAPRNGAGWPRSCSPCEAPRCPTRPHPGGQQPGSYARNQRLRDQRPSCAMPPDCRRPADAKWGVKGARAKKGRVRDASNSLAGWTALETASARARAVAEAPV